MNKKNRQILLILPVLALSAVSCVLSGPRLELGRLQTVDEVVELGDSETIVADIEMGAGELTIGSGASALMEASFRFNVEELEPVTEFGGERMMVHSPSVDFSFDSLWDIDEYQNEWVLAFNDAVELEMIINIGAGSSLIGRSLFRCVQLHIRVTAI